MTESVNNVRRQISNHVKAINLALQITRNTKNGLPENIRNSINKNHVEKILNIQKRANEHKQQIRSGERNLQRLIEIRKSLSNNRSRANRHASAAQRKRTAALARKAWETAKKKMTKSMVILGVSAASALLTINNLSEWYDKRYSEPERKYQENMTARNKEVEKWEEQCTLPATTFGMVYAPPAMTKGPKPVACPIPYPKELTKPPKRTIGTNITGAIWGVPIMVLAKSALIALIVTSTMCTIGTMVIQSFQMRLARLGLHREQLKLNVNKSRANVEKNTLQRLGKVSAGTLNMAQDILMALEANNRAQLALLAPGANTNGSKMRNLKNKRQNIMDLMRETAPLIYQSQQLLQAFGDSMTDEQRRLWNQAATESLAITSQTLANQSASLQQSGVGAALGAGLAAATNTVVRVSTGGLMGGRRNRARPPPALPRAANQPLAIQAPPRPANQRTSPRAANQRTSPRAANRRTPPRAANNLNFTGLFNNTRPTQQGPKYRE
jgi:hypothetical protein